MFILIILRDVSFLLTGNKVTKSAAIYHVYGRRAQCPKELLLHDDGPRSGPKVHPQPFRVAWAIRTQVVKSPESQKVAKSSGQRRVAPLLASSPVRPLYLHIKRVMRARGGRENAFLMEPQQLPGRLRCCSWFLAPCSAEKYAKKLSTLVIFICVPASCFGATRRMRNAKANALSPATHAKK